MKIHFKVGKVQWNSPKRAVRRKIDFCGLLRGGFLLVAAHMVAVLF